MKYSNKIRCDICHIHDDRSQFSPAGWYGKIGEATIDDAVLDRIIHDSS
jgi:hypothetical protein